MIEQLGGYELAKQVFDSVPKDGNSYTVTRDDTGASFHSGDIFKALLEYRRQHNIFEVGDLIVFLSNIAPEHDGIYTITEIFKNSCFVIEDGMDYRAFYDYIRHATDEEIQAGRRL